MILSAFRRTHRARNIKSLYGAIVAQARSAVFYTDCGVPDTVEGRFELIVLHLVLVLRRLGRLAGENGGASSGSTLGFGRAPGQALGQDLFDAFCRDLDDNLREMGVGDLGVPRRMRRFGEAFYGRQAAYNAALDATDPHELEKALARNIFGDTDAGDGAVRLARYALAAATQSDAEMEDTLLTGQAVFPGPETFTRG